MQILLKEPMSYKQQIKNNELITKLRIVKLIEKGGVSQVDVAEKFLCHRNTVGNILHCFKKEFDNETKEKLLNKTDWKQEQLKEVLQPLKNASRRPHRHPDQATELEEAVIASWLFNEKKIKVGAKRMKTYIRRKFKDSKDSFLQSLTNLSLRQIRGIYKRYELKGKKKRSCTGTTKHIHDYKSLACFEEAHFDTKHILDQKALPKEIYEKFQKSLWMPKYQWTLQFAKPRFRFLAFSHNLNSEFGLKYLLFCLMYIRYLFNNWDTRITVGMDQGNEFCRGSERKLKKWNKTLALIDAEAYQYHLNNDIRKNLIERSHKTDDNEFYIPRADAFLDKKSFLQEAAGYYHYFNFLRPHSGVAMNNRTPYEIIQEANFIMPERLMKFPVMLLEKNIHTLRKTTDFLLFNSELREQKQEKVTPKKIVDISQKYDFFKPRTAQNVLTYYHMEQQKNSHMGSLFLVILGGLILEV
jgi:hypothetical protein